MNLEKMGIALEKEKSKVLTEGLIQLFKKLEITLDKKSLKTVVKNLIESLEEQGESLDFTPTKGVLQQLRDFICDRFDAESTALFATARLWDDGLIDPRDTRTVLGHCLSICRDAQHRTLYPSSFGVARP